MSWNPQGQCRRGRPRRSWRKTVEEEAEIVERLGRESGGIALRRLNTLEWSNRKLTDCNSDGLTDNWLQFM